MAEVHVLLKSMPDSTVQGNLQGVRRLPFTILLIAALCANFFLVNGHDQQRIVEISVLLVAGFLMLIMERQTFEEWFATYRSKALGVFFTLGMLSSTLAFAPQFAFFELSVFFLLYLMANAVAREVARGGHDVFRFIVQAIALIIAIYALKFVLDYLSSMSLRLPLFATDFTSGFSNIRFFNHTQTPTLPLLILLCCPTSHFTKSRRLWLVVASYWWMALFATSGRGTLVGMVVGNVVVAIVLHRMAFPYLKQVILTAVIGLAAYFAFLVVIPELIGAQGMSAFSEVSARTAADPVSHRLFLWERAAGLIAAHPLLGVGPMHFAHNAGDLHTGAHPHNWLMQIGSEWGLPALVCLIGSLALGLRALIHVRTRINKGDKANQAVLAALLVATVAILVDGLVSGLFVMPQSQLAIALFLGCTMGWYRLLVPATASTREFGNTPRIVAGVLVIAAMTGIASVWPEMLKRLENQPLTAIQQAANTGMHWPRLWEAGFF